MDAELERWLASGERFDYLGFDIFYRAEGSGPPLLLIHGYPFNSFDWAPIWPTLTQRLTVVAPDMMGMGFSAKPVAYEYSVADHADMHEALLAHLNIRNAHILAHDIGDSVGQEMLARHEFGQQTYGEWRIDSITWLNGGMFIEAYTPRAAQKLMSQTPLGDVFSHLQDTALPRRLLEPTLREMFGPNTKPTRHMMDGAHMARRYAEVIPDPNVVMLADDIGHWPQLEAPDAVLTHFLAHIDRTATG